MSLGQKLLGGNNAIEVYIPEFAIHAVVNLGRLDMGAETEKRMEEIVLHAVEDTVRLATSMAFKKAVLNGLME